MRVQSCGVVLGSGVESVKRGIGLSEYAVGSVAHVLEKVQERRSKEGEPQRSREGEKRERWRWDGAHGK